MFLNFRLKEERLRFVTETSAYSNSFEPLDSKC